jgi:hypothetical protein
VVAHAVREARCTPNIFYSYWPSVTTNPNAAGVLQISHAEEMVLVEARLASRSHSLYPAVLLALNACMRCLEIRLLRRHARCTRILDAGVRLSSAATIIGVKAV